MSYSQYEQIFEDLKRDLFSVAKRHGKRALREAVRDAANGNLLLEDDPQGEDIPPEELDYPEEGVWTVPPPPDDEDDGEDGEISDAAEKVLADIMDKLEERAGK
jgi:hypothetical protein